MMINKENQRRKMEDSKKESRTQTKIQKEGERERENRESSIQEKKDTEKNRI